MRKPFPRVFFLPDSFQVKAAALPKTDFNLSASPRRPYPRFTTPPRTRSHGHQPHTSGPDYSRLLVPINLGEGSPLTKEIALTSLWTAVNWNDASRRAIKSYRDWQRAVSSLVLLFSPLPLGQDYGADLSLRRTGPGTCQNLCSQRPHPRGTGQDPAGVRKK